MKYFKLILGALIIVVLSSCGITKNSGKYHEKEVVNRQINTHEIYADMEFDETTKITGSATATYFMFFKLSGDNHYADIQGSFDMPFSKTGPVKKAAQYKALNSSNADFIAKPSYTITKRTYLMGLFTQVDAKVSGYGGVYKNFKQVDNLDRDVEILTNKKLVEQLNLNK